MLVANWTVGLLRLAIKPRYTRHHPHGDRSFLYLANVASTAYSFDILELAAYAQRDKCKKNGGEFHVV